MHSANAMKSTLEMIPLVCRYAACENYSEGCANKGETAISLSRNVLLGICFKKNLKQGLRNIIIFNFVFYYIGSAEGHEYPDLQVGDEVNPRPDFIFS
jgi:hypothetical protein